jgi:hypothetical protein
MDCLGSDDVFEHGVTPRVRLILGVGFEGLALLHFSLWIGRSTSVLGWIWAANLGAGRSNNVAACLILR